MARMILYPAIDLLDGRCVSPRETADTSEPVSDASDVSGVFDGEPLAVARRWRDAGAGWLHIVDLDGVLGGEPHHLDLIGEIVRETGLSVQCGGGLRSEATVEAAFATGVERVVLGTTALRNPELLAVCLNRWGRRIAVSVDSRGGKVLLAGWLDKASDSALDFATRMAEAGVHTIVLSNVAQDGTIAGLDLTSLTAARAALPATEIIAAGNIASLDDIRALAGAGLDGAILGRALYAGGLELAEALRLVPGGQEGVAASPGDQEPEATGTASAGADHAGEAQDPTGESTPLEEPTVASTSEETA